MSNAPYTIDRETFDERRESLINLQRRGFKVIIPSFSDFEKRVATAHTTHEQLPPQIRPRFPKVVTEKALFKWSQQCRDRHLKI